MQRILSLVFVLLVLMAQSGFAMDLQSAKAKGLVGETSSGYLAVVKGGNAQAAQLVKTVNAKRRQQYHKIAKRNGTKLHTVEKLAGKKAIEKTPRGQYIKANGSWRKK